MKFWHECDLSDWRDYEQLGDMYIPFRPYLRKLTQATFDTPEHFSGRGIVIPAGGRLLPGAYVTLKLLREFGCKLPVEIWHLGPAEIPDVWRGLFEGLDVIFRDAHAEAYQVPNLSGWQLKPYAIIHSRFEEVLFLDADNHPAQDPTYLFEVPEYKKTGAVFWPDRVPHDVNHPIWDVFGVPYRDEPAHETGQMLIDKSRCWHALQIAMHCNEFSSFHYRYSHGDTATFRFAFHSLQQPFTMIPHRLLEVPIDREVEDIKTLETTPYMREPGDIRACFLQRDFEGKVIFQHRSGGGGAQAAFGLKDNPAIQHFAYEDECLEWLAEAKRRIENESGFFAGMEQLHPEKISPHRRAGLRVLFDLMTGIDKPQIVETGTMRQKDNWHNDGGFTWFLSQFQQRFGGSFATVDIDPEAIKLCKELTDGPIEYVTADSVEYLKSREKSIDVLMLDSFDYDGGKEKQAQAHNLNEVMAALPHMADHGIIAIDDCALAGGGKGGLSVPYLEGCGWRIVHRDYLVILRKEDSANGRS